MSGVSAAALSHASPPAATTGHTGAGVTMELGLSGKRAIITGASKGIGAAVACEYSREGARIALIARDEERLRGVASLCGSSAIVVAADLSSADELRRAFAQCIDQLGGVDILVNNAGS